MFRAIRVSLLVGTLLALINHFSAIMAGAITAETGCQILLTYFVPYAVSTYSSFQAIVNINNS